MIYPTTNVFTKDCLKGKVAFVTGGGTGICRGITEAFLRHGKFGEGVMEEGEC